MNFFQQSPNHPSLTKRFSRLIAALLEHLLALSSLASWEAKQGFKEVLLCLLCLCFALIIGFIGYLLLLAILVVVAISSWHLSLLFTLSLMVLSHFLMLAILLLLFYRNRPTSFLKLTRDELLRDIEMLHHS